MPSQKFTPDPLLNSMLQNALRTLRTLLPADTATAEAIVFQVDRVLILFPTVNRDDLIRAASDLYKIRADPWSILEAKDRTRPWLDARRAGIDWRFWTRYDDYLRVEKNFAPDPLLRLDRLTDTILDRLFDPNADVVLSKRGLVVGQVQSGKTANYTGLVSKAADAGYGIVIVLAGLHNNLRSQTQLRLDEGFLGRDTQIDRVYKSGIKAIGVGKIRPGLVAHSITSSEDKGDFSAGAFKSLGVSFDTAEPILLVVKKNQAVLTRLRKWLASQADVAFDGGKRIGSKSLLLIDDEADHASVNTKKSAQDATKINGQIRDVLRIFLRSAYVGYTATPFANLFIDLDEDQLFPRDFIVNLPPPSNYIGPERVFGFQPVPDDEPDANVLPIVHRIDDFGPLVPHQGEKKSPMPTVLPESLRLAIRCFVLTCAIRRLRGQTVTHNSMLIHVTRYTARQDAVRNLVDAAFDFYRRGIAQNDPTVLETLRQTFEDDAAGYRSFRSTSQQILDAPDLRGLDAATAVHAWADVKKHLHEAAARIRVMTINGGSADALNYFDHPDGLSVIAIGGDKLSRGLTLEGLSVSYYLRTSEMYDTLMQMGRWFGYRPGYVDLCRLFTSRSLNEWFCHITLASEELRDEFDYMTSIAGATPYDYALKVRTHPGTLKITALNKMQNAVTIRLSFAGRLIETYKLNKAPAIVQGNYDATRRFVAGLGQPERRGEHYLWPEVGVQTVLDFLEKYRPADNLDPQTLSRFIRLQTPHGELIHWVVVLISTSKPKRAERRPAEFEVDGETVTVGTTLRNPDEILSNDSIYYVRKSHILDPNHEFLDLSPDEYERAMKLTREFREEKKKTGEPLYPNGQIVRNQIRAKSTALLLLYSLDPAPAGLPDASPVLGYAISFPGSNHNAAVDYAVHTDLMEKFRRQTIEDDEGEEVPGDDA